jgi:HPt (histidine-containing phosphotransfer) domain-containing protein
MRTRRARHRGNQSDHVSTMPSSSSAELHATFAPADTCCEADVPLIDQRVMDDWRSDMVEEDVLSIIARVPAETSRSLADFRKAIASGDLASARRTAHRLKGMANNLGAARLARMARTIELGCHSIEEVSTCMPPLQQTLDETLEALRSGC